MATATKNQSNFLSLFFTDGILVRGGDVWQNTSNLFENAGNNGNYWSSTPHSNGTNAYNLNFNGTSTVNPSNNNNRQNGFSVRYPYGARSPKIIILRHFAFIIYMELHKQQSPRPYNTQ